MLTDADERALRRYFRRRDDLSTASSITGAMWEAQSLRYVDSEGHRIGPAEDWVYIAIDETRPAPRQDGAAFMPELGKGAMSMASVSRRLLQLIEEDQAVLASWYGDMGMHWETVFEGVHRNGCLFAFTDTGKLLFAEFGGGMGQHKAMEAIVRRYETTPEEDREEATGRALRLMSDEATALLRRAKAAFGRSS